MKLLKDVFKFYLHSSIHVGLAVLSLLWATSYFLNNIPGKGLSIFVFCSTIATYNFIKYGVEAHKYLIVSNRYHRSIQFFSIANQGLALIYIGQLNKSGLILLLFVAFLIAIYAIPIYPRLKNLRNYGIPKVLLVALVWTLITSLLPMLQFDVVWGWDRYLDLTQRFLLILVLMVPFEIRDLNVDLPELRTIPQRIGETATKALGYSLAIVYFLLTFLKDDLHPQELMNQAVLLLLLILILVSTSRRQSEYYAAFWVEAVPVIWLGVIWVLDLLQLSF
ncbi:hypothetical protein [Lentiprolixibacter aurantiacus]|uniref:Prenyltransferase n=1 Tax=Lentiprolixibacter aurantiacus TaxID=2993939 RepID=A0AAE3SPZ7_9FLAO|nr:hypothetical protein [Lentiprolixibacter aurantiacus]MCX2720721.1 hypothetical protein [Lentiprolixibacter aurantiacus]